MKIPNICQIISFFFIYSPILLFPDEPIIQVLKSRSVEIEYTFQELSLIPVSQIGSGFIIESVIYDHPLHGVVILDRVITNAHVISPIIHTPDLSIKGTFGQEYDYYYLSYFDRQMDIAILFARRKYRPNTLKLDKVSLLSEANQGDDVLIIASPSGLTGTLSKGYISAKRIISNIPHLQFSAPSSPGSSGAGVFTHDGKLAAILNSGLGDSNSFNFGVSIPDNLDYFASVLESTNDEGYLKIGTNQFFIDRRQAEIAQAIGYYEGPGDIYGKTEIEEKQKLLPQIESMGYFPWAKYELEIFEKKYAPLYFGSNNMVSTWVALEMLKFSGKYIPYTFHSLAEDSRFYRLRIFPHSYDDFCHLNLGIIGYFGERYDRVSALVFQGKLTLALHYGTHFAEHPEYMRLLAILAQEREHDKLWNPEEKQIYKEQKYPEDDWIIAPDTLPVSYYLEQLMGRVLTHSEWMEENSIGDEFKEFTQRSSETSLGAFFGKFKMFDRRYRDYVLRELRNKGWDISLLDEN